MLVAYRNFFAVFTVIVSFFCLVQSAHAATLSLNPSSSTVTLGDEFDMVVRIDTQAERVTSTDVVLTYDRNLLQVVSVSKGLSGSNAFFPDFFQSLSSGQIYMGGSVISPTDTRIGEGVFSTVRFRTLTLGNATVGFVCQQGATNDTNISRADKNATDIVSCLALKNVFYAISQTPPSIQSIQIHAQSKTVKVGDKPIGLSALAYDQNSLPIWSGVTYEWGISSASSIGSVSPTFGTVTNFNPLNVGAGDVYVVARMGTQMQAAGVQMTVTQELRGDLNDDGKVNLTDLSALLSNFGKSNKNRNQGDINGDRLVNLQDLSMLLSNFGKSAPIAGAVCRQYDLSLIPENQSVQTAGYGTVSVLLNPVANTLEYSVSYTNLTSSETMAHIHGFASVGQTAGILHTLPVGTTKTGTWQYQENQEQSILGGLAYFNIHTLNYPGGELRSQVQGGFPVDCQ